MGSLLRLVEGEFVFVLDVYVWTGIGNVFPVQARIKNLNACGNCSVRVHYAQCC